MTKIAFASDHAGYTLKQELIAFAQTKGFDAIDLGTNSTDSVDYPDFGSKAALAIKNGDCDKAVIICGSGIGISIAANRHKEVRAALCHDVTSARLARQHNDANIIAFGARFIGIDVAKDCLITFLETEFEGGRHQKRVEKL